jgi:hypothetical protein
MNRRIGWRLHTLLTDEERDLLEALLIMGPEQKKTSEKLKELIQRTIDQHRVIFGATDTRSTRGDLVTYRNYAGNEDTIPAERLLWNFFPGTLDERGGMVPKVRDVAWTMNIVVVLVQVNAVRSVLVAHDDVETEVAVKPTARTIADVLNDGDYMEPIAQVLAPVANELASGLMMKRTS